MKFKRQVFVMFHVVSPPSMDAEKPEDLVMKSIFQEFSGLIKDEDNLESMIEMQWLESGDSDSTAEVRNNLGELSIHP